MSKPELYPYPQTPPDCQDESGERFAVPCRDCPFAPECGYLAVSRTLVDARGALITGNQDGVIPGFYNLAGINAIIDRDPQLAEDLVRLRVGLLGVDIRGVKVANDEWGPQFGDAVLRTAGLRLLDEGVRSRADIISHEQRHNWRPGKFDIACRTGESSDELYVLIRDVDENELIDIADRTYNRFSIEQALQDCQTDHLPIPGNVAYVHAANIETPQYAPDSSVQERAQAIFQTMRETNANPFGPSKDEQHAEMWRSVVEASPGITPRKPADNREIYLSFIRAYVPNIDEVMRQARASS